MNDLEKYNKIFDEFCEWVVGIEEDDPLPPEIHYIYFVFWGDCGVNALQYTGCEYEPKTICSCDYFPLEAQFFYSRDYLKLPKEQAKQFAKIFVQDIMQLGYFEQLFFGKIVKFVEYGETLKKRI